MRIARVYLDCDLRCGFEGLTKAAKGTKVSELGKGDFVLFMNRAGTAFKILAGNQYLTYFKNGHRRIPLDAIQLLPEYFDGQRLDMVGAVKETVLKKLKIQV